MTRARAMDVINDSTTLQSRIDTVLSAPIMEWDNSPDIDWQPGDPIYAHPKEREDLYESRDEFGQRYLFSGGNHARRMYDVIHDYYSESLAHQMACQTCFVSGDIGETECWNCGKRYDKPRLPRVAKPPRLRDGVVMPRPQRDRALSQMHVYMQALNEVVAEQTIGRVERVTESMRGLHVEFTIFDEGFRRSMQRMSSMTFDFERLAIIAPRRSGRGYFQSLWTTDEWLERPETVTLHIHPDHVARVPRTPKVFDFDLGLRKPVVTNFNYNWFRHPRQGYAIEIPSTIPTRSIAPPEGPVVTVPPTEQWRLNALREEHQYLTSIMATSQRRRRTI